MKISLKNFFEKSNKRVKKVKDMLSNGKNIYKNTDGCEQEINYKLYDLPSSLSGLKKLVASITVLYPGKVNKEYKMTTGHFHPQEEIYFFLQGSGKIIVDKKVSKVGKNDLITIPKNSWHRVINTGKEKLIFLCIFEKYGGRG